MRILVALLVGLTALAGCTDAPVEPTDQSTNLADDGLVATSETGVIRGVVVDATITPVVGAKITLVSDGRETQSAEDGSFGFSEVEPGLQFLQVSKLGYEGPVQAQADVEAGVALPPVVRINMVADPSSAPYYEIIPWAGYMQCGGGGGGVGSANPCGVFEIPAILGLPDPCADVTCSDNTFDVEVPSMRKPDLVQVEMAWTGSQALGNALDIGINRPGTLSDFTGVAGESPLMFRATAEEMAAGMGTADYGNYTLRVFPSATEDNPTLFLDQEFEVFVIHFYGFLPNEDYRLVNDGEPTIPT